VLRFAVEVNGNRDFTFGVCVAARPGYLGNGAGSLENLAAGQSPTKFGFPLIADLCGSRKDEVLSRVAEFTVPGEGNRQLRPHHRRGRIAIPIYIVGLVKLFVQGDLEGVKPRRQSDEVAW